MIIVDRIYRIIRIFFLFMTAVFIPISAVRQIVFSGFRQETGKTNYPINPVNPVRFKN
jgi:hypothetical protein